MKASVQAKQNTEVNDSHLGVPLAKVKDRQPSNVPGMGESQGLDSHEALGTVAESKQHSSKRNSNYNTQSQPATILKKSLGAKGETLNIQIDL